MKLYVAGKFSSYAKVRMVIDLLRNRGHTITHDWTRTKEFESGGVPKEVHRAPGERPDLPRAELAEHAKNDLWGCEACDALVLCADDSLAGAYIEMGIVLRNVQKKIYVIAPDRWTVFFELPNVILFDTYEEFFAYMETMP